MAKTPHPTPHLHEKLFQHNLIIFGYIDQRVLTMTQTSETVTYSLESVLTRIESKIDSLQRDVNQKIDSLQRDVNQKFDSLQRDVDQKIDNLQRDMDQKFDSLQKDVNDLKVEVTEIKGDIKTLDQKVETMDKRLEKVEDSYAILVKDIADLKGFKSLIIPMVVAFLSAVVTLGLRGFFLGNKP
jgi:chromosome segregation ATPase